MLFFLPTAVAPRYHPWHETDAVGTGALAGMRAGVTISIAAHMASAITTVTCATHDVTSTPSATDPCAATVTLAHQETHLAKDLVVLVATATPHQPRMVVEHNAATGQHTAMLTLVPAFALAQVKCEFVFIVDRSGSMAGSKIAQARDALQVPRENERGFLGSVRVCRA